MIVGMLILAIDFMQNHGVCSSSGIMRKVDRAIDLGVPGFPPFSRYSVLVIELLISVLNIIVILVELIIIVRSLRFSLFKLT